MKMWCGAMLPFNLKSCEATASEQLEVCNCVVHRVSGSARGPLMDGGAAGPTPNSASNRSVLIGAVPHPPSRNVYKPCRLCAFTPERQLQLRHLSLIITKLNLSSY